MTVAKQELQLQAAVWALKRIVRKQGGLYHLPPEPNGETCDCPQCIAKYALEQITGYEGGGKRERPTRT